MNLPEFPVVVVEHPIGSLVADEIKAHANNVYLQALDILQAD